MTTEGHQATQPAGGPLYAYPPPALYPPYPWPPPPPPPRRRRSRRVLWIVLTYALAFAVLAGTAFVVTSMVFPRPRVIDLAFAGPATVEDLAALLVVPVGATPNEPELLDLDGEARAVQTGSATKRLVAARGHRWSALLEWTGNDGSHGSLRLAQFRWQQGAHAHHAVLLAREMGRRTAEEWPVSDVPRASVFTYDDRESGNVVRAVFGRSTVVGEILVTEATSQGREDVAALVYEVVRALPGPDWPAIRTAEEPPDLAALVMPAPAGMTALGPVRTQGMVATSDAMYEKPEEADEYLVDLAFKRCVVAEWSGGGDYVALSLIRFKGSSYDWATNHRTGLLEGDHAQSGDIPGVLNGVYLIYRGPGGANFGTVVFYKGDYGVLIQTEGRRVSTSDELVRLAQTQYERLP